MPDSPGRVPTALRWNLVRHQHAVNRPAATPTRKWIEKAAAGTPETKTLGGIEMIGQATVALSSMNPAPYSVNEVDRKALFNFASGRPVFELVDPDATSTVRYRY